MARPVAARGKKLSREALLVLDAVIVEGDVARIPVATAPSLDDLAPAFKNGDRLERKLYEEVNAALSALGGKWVGRKVMGHVFETDPSEAIGAVVETGEFVDAKKLYQFFETPPELAARLVELAEVDSGMRVLEPSAGRGAIVMELLASGAKVDVVELDPANVRYLSALPRDGRGISVLTEGDFLGFRPPRAFDRVVMNPPFSAQQDIDHVRHAFDLLKPGGRLVSVMGTGVLFRENAKAVEFRRWCGIGRVTEEDLRLGDGDAEWRPSGREVRWGRIEKLPSGTFATSGTDVNAVVLVLEKAA